MGLSLFLWNELFKYWYVYGSRRKSFKNQRLMRSKSLDFDMLTDPVKPAA
jgi:hypothetical protein